VIFKDMDSGLREHEELVKQYFGTIIPQNDNKFAALNSAVWSGGSFIYVPPGVKIEMPLQAYFRINAENMGHFERTLIIVDEGAYVHYVEGCTAPIYSSDSLHSAVVEIIVKPNARWPLHDDPELVEQRLQPRDQARRRLRERDDGVGRRQPRFQADDEVSRDLGCSARAPTARCSSIAFGGKGQHQDAGGKAVHIAPNTTSVITSKSISKDGGCAPATVGLLEVAKGATGAKSKVVCDALILDDDSRSDTYPLHQDRRGQRRHRPRGDGLEDRRGAALLPDVARALGDGGLGDDRLRLRRADHQGAAASSTRSR